MNNDHVRKTGPGRAYFFPECDQLGKFLNNMSMTLGSGCPRGTLSNKQVAIATGIANTHFDIRRWAWPLTWPLRWTATMERTSGELETCRGSFSADAATNRLLTAATAFWKWMGLAIAALVLLGGSCARLCAVVAARV